MKHFNVLVIAALSLTGLAACDNSYYYPDSRAPRTRGGYIARDSYGSGYRESAPRVSTTSGYMVNHGDRYDRDDRYPQRGGYIERDSY